MKTKIISIVVMLMMACNVMGQDYMRVYFKNGTDRKFYLKDIATIATKKQDAEGKLHSDYEFQHITTHHNKYVYNLNEVDSITFCKFNEEEVINNLSNALPDLLNIYSECRNIQDAETFLQHINNLSGVEKAWSDGHQLFVSFDGWETMSFSFNHDEETESNIKERLVEQAKSLVSRMEHAVSPKAGQLRAVIANQQHYDESRRYYVDNYYLPLKKKLEDCNIFTKYEDKPELAFFSDSIFKYDIVFLSTHGGYEDLVHNLETADDFGRLTKKEILLWRAADQSTKSEMVREFLDAIDEKRNDYPESTEDHIYGNIRGEVENGDSIFIIRTIITESFIIDYANGQFQNPCSILFNTACQSLMGNDKYFFDIPYSDTLAKLFFNRNLGFYFGYNATNSIGKVGGPHFYELLLNGLSLERGYANLPFEDKYQYLEGNDVYLIPLQNPSLTNGSPMFLIQTYTEQIDQKVAMDNYNFMKAVEVVGYATTLKPDVLSYGFAYGTDRNLSEATMISVTDTISLIKAIEQGNLRFRGNLTDLHPGNTYYYCAYTYDGNSYNCGDTLSFYIEIIPDLALSAQEITLDARTTKTVEIISGSGNYTVSVDPPTYAAASLDGSVITIKGLKEGPAVVTVEDKVSHQTADIKVTVNAPDPTADMKTFTVNGVSFTMVNVEGGTYVMGANTNDSNAESKEKPRHAVSLSNYYIGQTEVTQELWTAVMGSNPSKFTDSDQLPVDCVSWDDCQDFVTILNELTGEKFRLPTEAEWEFAARGGLLSQGYKYSGSDNIDEVAWYKENAGDAPHPVATKAPNELGLYDMSGNTMEWVYDWYGNYKSTAQVNPTGPSSGTDKVERGGSWFNPSNYCRNSARFKVKITDKYSNLGLRLAQSSSENRFDQIVPEEILNEIEKHMPIFDGSNPPNIEGEYLVSPVVLLYDASNNFQAGKVFNDLYLKTYNQDMVNNTLDYLDSDGSSEAYGDGSFISGDGTHFTVYFNTEGIAYYTDYSVTFKQATVISGTKIDSGIGNLFYGYVMTEKSDDPKNYLMNVGQCRVVKDKDGTTPYYNWYSSNAPKRIQAVDWSLPGLREANPR